MDEATLAPWVTVIVTALITATVSAVISNTLGRNVLKKMDEGERKRDEARAEQATWRESIDSGIRSLLRSELIHEHRKWVERGYCPLESKEYVQHTYESYHNLGGNDIGTAMYRDLMELPTNEGLER